VQFEQSRQIGKIMVAKWTR